VGERCRDQRKRQYTQTDKDQFHAVLDRTGNIVAAARELGLNISTANTWVGRINPAARKPQNTRSVKTGRRNATHPR
jgi:transposase